IHKVGGMNFVDCTSVSEKASEQLDKYDTIQAAYFLEVSSPGAEKPLKTIDDFQRHIGENVYVSLYIHIDGEKEYTGILKAFKDQQATIEYKWKHTVKQVQI